MIILGYNGYSFIWIIRMIFFMLVYSFISASVDGIYIVGFYSIVNCASCVFIHKNKT